MPSNKGKRSNSKKGSAKPQEEKKKEEKVVEKKVAEKKGSKKVVENAEKQAVPAVAKMDLEEDEKKEVVVECKEFDRALELEDTNKEEAIRMYNVVIELDDPKGDLFKVKEQAVYNVTKLYATMKNTAVLKELLTKFKPFLNTCAKAKTAKIVRQVVEIVARNVEDLELQAEMCTDAIVWCQKEKRTFLKQRMQTRLAQLMWKQGKFKDSIKLINKVVKEVKKFDDKLLLVEINLLESEVYHSLENLPKSKGALTSARSAANAVYCPPLLQAQIDLQAGTLCAEEKDYKTAFSYFYEAFEGYNTIGYTAEAMASIKYMLLSKIMTGQAEDVYSIVNGKAGVKYAGPGVAAMKEVADAYKKRSIHAFQAVYDKYKSQLADDRIINGHLTELRANLLEQNLIRLIEPFSRVQIAHVAKLIDLDPKKVENKLSEMILDKKFAGILDQGSGDLIIFDDLENDKTYEASLDTVKELSGVVDRLYVKAKHITAK